MRRRLFQPVAISACVFVLGACGDESKDVSEPPGARSVDFPRVEHGKCPRTPGGHAARDVAITLGSGPAYPVLGFSSPPPRPGGVVDLSDDPRRRRSYAHKTLWTVSPEAPSRITVVGRQLDGDGRVRFLTRPGGVRKTLPLRPSAKGWTYAVTDTLLPGPGCFGFKMEGEGVAEIVVFRAVSRAAAGLRE
jgi:hypothetical protein